MDTMETKMNAILGNPDMMQKIMAMAQSLNGPTEQETMYEEKQEHEQMKQDPFMNLNMDSIKKLAGLAGSSNIDRNQQSLLRALGPYLKQNRISRLEKAMRAAKMAMLATSFLGDSDLLFKAGR